MIRIILLAGLLLAAVSTSSLWWLPPVTEEEEAVYRAVLEQTDWYDARPEAVARRTFINVYAAQCARQSPFAADWFLRDRPSPELIADFRRVVGKQAIIPRGFSDAGGLPLSNTHDPLQEILRYLNPNPYVTCATGRPGHVRFSRVGFSAQRDAALVAIDSDCPLCTYSAIQLLRKVEGRWRLTQEGFMTLAYLTDEACGPTPKDPGSRRLL